MGGVTLESLLGDCLAWGSSAVDFSNAFLKSVASLSVLNRAAKSSVLPSPLVKSIAVQTQEFGVTVIERNLIPVVMK